jgi:long-chain acyl-CoA synthetase
MSFGSRVLAHAAAYPGRRAVVCDGDALTYGALIAKARRCAARIQACGLEAGGSRRVAVLASNSLDYAVVIVACQLVGTSVAPLPCLVSADALARMLDDSATALLFHDREYAELARSAVDGARNGAALTVVEIGGLDGGPSLDDWLDSSLAEPSHVQIEPRWESDLIYSSGTTGMPKGISQSHAGRVAQNVSLAQLGIGEGAGVLHTVGQYSNFGMIAIYLSLWWAGTYFIMRKFSAPELVRVLAEETIHLVFVAPATIIRAVDAPGFEAAVKGKSSIKLSSGSQLTLPLKRRVLASWPGPLLDAYGQTETGALTLLRAHEVPEEKLGSVGIPLPTTVLRILDEDGNVLPPGSEGEIAGHTPTLMSGYHGRPEATVSAYWYDDQGRRYVRTGDIGRLDTDGYLWLCDRKKDMIISGGFNVYPADIERVLVTHPAVFEAAVVGCPSTRWGETPVAFLTLRDGHAADPEELRAWVNSQVGSVQRVAAVKIVPDLPRGSLGKLLKRELREELAREVGTLP